MLDPFLRFGALSRPKAGFQSVPVRVDFLMLVSDEHAKRKSGRSGGSGLFPAIKTALVDVCHRKKVWHITILKSYGELGLGRPLKDATRTNVLSQNSNHVRSISIINTLSYSRAKQPTYYR